MSAAFPTLASVTKANNTDFLPASTPSMQAAKLAEPFQKADLVAVTAVAAASSGALTATGTTVTSAGLVLAGTFAVFAAVAGSGPGARSC